MRFLICLFTHLLYKLVRPAWFWLTRKDAEVAHEQGMWMLRIIGSIRPFAWGLRQLTAVRHRKLRCSIRSRRRRTAALELENPVMLAAGFCKYAGPALRGLEALGFGATVLGTVTVDEEQGNARPRMFRYSRQRALINRMRFNNDGSGKTRQKLQRLGAVRTPRIISIGKSVNTPAGDLTRVIADYSVVLLHLYELGDAFEINISSPNSEALRDLQKSEYLRQLLEAVVFQRNTRAGDRPRKPLYVKVDPDMPLAELDAAVDVCLQTGVDGIVVANTTIDHSSVPEDKDEVGGLSGRPLFDRAHERVACAAARAAGRLTIIAVGGIFTARDAWSMFEVGADLVQIWTALPYQGPLVVQHINRGLLQLMRQRRIDHVSMIRTW